MNIIELLKTISRNLKIDVRQSMPPDSACLGKLDVIIAEMEKAEPVAWLTPDGEGFRVRFTPPTNDTALGWDALFTHPQPVKKAVLVSETELLMSTAGRTAIGIQKAFAAKNNIEVQE